MINSINDTVIDGVFTRAIIPPEMQMNCFFHETARTEFITLQENNWFRSCCKDKVSQQLETVLKHLVSSAYKRDLENVIMMQSGRSLIYSANNNEPNILPWDTPNVTGNKSDN